MPVEDGHCVGLPLTLVVGEWVGDWLALPQEDCDKDRLLLAVRVPLGEPDTLTVLLRDALREGEGEPLGVLVWGSAKGSRASASRRHAGRKKGMAVARKTLGS